MVEANEDRLDLEDPLKGPIEDARRILETYSATDDLRKQIQLFKDATLRVMREKAIADARKKGYETLTTDTKDTRTARQLQDSGAFSLGLATTCIAIGLVHPEVGISGSHRNTVTVDDTVDAIVRLEHQRGTEPLSYQEELLDTVTPERLAGVLRQTTHEALDGFAEIVTGNYPAEIAMYLYGMNYWPRADIGPFNYILAQAREHSLLVNGMIRNIQVHNRIGRAAQLIYGGPTHPQYPIPTFLRVA